MQFYHLSLQMQLNVEIIGVLVNKNICQNKNKVFEVNLDCLVIFNSNINPKLMFFFGMKKTENSFLKTYYSYHYSE